MEVRYRRQDSRPLGRPMEAKIYGHAGRPLVMFPTSNGRFFQYEDTGTIAALSPFIDAGRIQVWTLDGIDGETFHGGGPDVPARIARHEAYFRYVRDEALPALAMEAGASGELAPLMSGCSMGAFHAANFTFRFPERVAGLIALSGVYSTRHFFGPALDGAIYFNSPTDYLAGLEDEAILSRIRACRLFLCCGQGAWEDEMLEETRTLEQVLRRKHIPAWVDYWGDDADHDWPWWDRQIVYFLDRWLVADGR